MQPTKNSPQPWRKIIFGALLPILAFTWLEEKYGILWGVIGGMVFSCGEIFFEYWQEKRVSTLSWVAAVGILVLGSISIMAQDGLWFKLQPAIFEGAMALTIFVFGWRGRPFLLWLLEQQKQSPPAFLQTRFKGVSWRLGVFFALHAVLATWAAWAWSTRSWAMLKGVGFLASFFLYFGVEVYFLRRAAMAGARR
jgi:intracellular septation protein